MPPETAYIYVAIILAVFAAIYCTKKITAARTVFYIVGGLITAALFGHFTADEFQLKCVISEKDGRRYCVRERSKRVTGKAANLLAAVVHKCEKMVQYMDAKYPADARVRRLVEGFRGDRISETLPTSELTAYSENKGEKIAFCLNRNKDNNMRLIDLNTLTFVALHELSHIMTPTVGHHQDFWTNFKFLLENAKAAGIYHPVNYKENPQEYCGMTITDNPYFDLV